MTEPSIIPCTKYFCRNGYTQIIGNTDIIIAVACTEKDVTFACAVYCADWASVGIFA
ncbi:hypothetical protein D3C79_1049840 [compost metagenome]